MEDGMLLLVNRIDEWTYARLVAIEVVDDDITITCVPRPDDKALPNILSDTFRAFGLACGAIICHASLRNLDTRHENGEELLKIDCRRVAIRRTLDMIAEEKAEQMEIEWDKPIRELGRYDGMMGFSATLPIRPGFVTLVNQVAWRVLLGRDMPLDYGRKSRFGGFTSELDPPDPHIRKLLETPCPFRLLHPLAGRSVMEFVALSRLFASYLLMDRGVVEVIRDFAIEIGPDDLIRVSFLGGRAGVTPDDLPIQVMVQGTFQPGLSVAG